MNTSLCMSWPSITGESVRKSKKIVFASVLAIILNWVHNCSIP